MLKLSLKQRNMREKLQAIFSKFHPNDYEKRTLDERKALLDYIYKRESPKGKYLLLQL